MKKLCLLSLFLATSFSALAQTEQFKKGQLDFQAGVGFISTLKIAMGDAGIGGDLKSKFTIPPPTLSLDYGITDEISIGGYANYSDLGFHLSDGTFVESDKIIMFGARGLYHLDLLPQLDTYGGVGLAYGSYTATLPGYFVGDPDIKSTSGNLYYQLIAGSRYRFTPNTGVFVELGYGVTVINLGLNLKF